MRPVCSGEVKRALVLEAAKGFHCRQVYNLRWSCRLCSEDGFTARFPDTAHLDWEPDHIFLPEIVRNWWYFSKLPLCE